MKKIVKFFWKHKINVLFYSAYTFVLGILWFAVIIKYEKFDKWDYMFVGALSCGLWAFICIDYWQSRVNYWQHKASFWREKYSKEAVRCSSLKFLGKIDE